MQIALLGLPITGKIICEKLLADGHEVIVWSLSKEDLEEIRVEKAEFIVNQKLIIAHNIDELRNYTRKPRIILSMLDAGEPTESMMQQLNQLVESGDVIIDGSASNFKDTQRHFDDFEKKGVRFLGMGVSGGIHAFENGFSLMLGGNPDAYQYVIPVLESLVKPNGIHTYFGTGGAGHFVQMVASGIEAGMMQAIAEGLSIASKSDYQLNLMQASNTWQAGSSISSFLLDLVIDSLSDDPTLSQFNGSINDNHEANFAIEQAKATNLSVPVTAQSVEYRNRSQYDKLIQDTLIAKLIQAMLYEYIGE